MGELDLTAAEKSAADHEIKNYVLEHSGLKADSLHIAQVKRKCGIIEREKCNKPQSEDARQPQCPPEKEEAIKEALRLYGMNGEGVGCMYKIFLVENDAVIAAAVAEHIASWGWEVRRAKDYTNVVGEFVAFQPHLVLLDIGLPFCNGYHWCAEIRRISPAPIIFLSSAADNMNIVMAMNMGGDDFIPKSFDLDVLTAKVQAMLRRTYDFGAASPLLEHDGAVLDTGDNTLTYRDRKLELTRNEYRILQVLMEHKGRIVSRETLMQKLWETDSFVDENTLTVNVTRLRRKLEGIGLADFIHTKKGLGYLVG